MHGRQKLTSREKIIWTLAITTIVVLSLSASNPATVEQLSGKLILEKAIGKTGCNIPWSTRIEEGTYIAWNTPGWGTLRAHYTRIVKRPDMVKIDQDFSAFDHPFFRTYYYYKGDSWAQVNLVTRKSERAKIALEEFLANLDWVAYYLNSSDEISTTDINGSDSIIAGKEYYRVLCTGKSDTAILDIEKNKFLPLRLIEPTKKRQTIYEDFRSVNKRTLPFHIIIYDKGKKTQEFIWERIEFDKNIPDTIFVENQPAN